ncbi:MAG: hypothetical protein RL291_501 [Pseudomonadota bacterium]|jgi:lysophospholipase L1-like esterase
MSQVALKLTLGPLLYAQGAYARFVTPKLPEPPGPRAGVTGRGKPLRLLVFGDSASVGVGVDHQMDGLIGHTLRGLEQTFTVTWSVWGKTGGTTETTMELLKDKAPAKFDVAITSLGVNDVTRQVPLKTWLAQQQALFDLLEAKFAVEHIYFSGFAPLHLFPVMPQPLRWFIGRECRIFDNAMADLATRRPCLEHVPNRMKDVPSLLASDGFHPGIEFYRQWGVEAAHRILHRFGSKAEV